MVVSVHHIHMSYYYVFKYLYISAKFGSVELANDLWFSIEVIAARQSSNIDKRKISHFTANKVKIVL